MTGAACPRVAQPGRTRWARPSEEEQPGRPGAAQRSSRDGLAHRGTWPTGPTGAQLPAGGSRRRDAAAKSGWASQDEGGAGPPGQRHPGLHRILAMPARADRETAVLAQNLRVPAREGQI
jgi:hypothetical protein